MGTKHTPGPWCVYQGWVHPNFDGPSPQATNGDTAICEPLGPDRYFNAILLSSAPDLLAALIGCIEHMEWPTPQGKAAWAAAKATIAKATGGA